MSILFESTQLVKTSSKRDIASANSTQNEKIIKTARRKRDILAESTSNSETDEPKKKNMPKKKKVKKQTPELAFDLEAEPRPTIIETSSGTTEIGSKQTDQIGQKEGTVQERRDEKFPKIEQNLEKRQELVRPQRRAQPESSRGNDVRSNGTALT